jgi:RNA exonuclease 1
VSNKDPERYTLSLDQMIDNDYPIPSYMADVFQKLPGWVETPQVLAGSLMDGDAPKPVVYAIDCEMVRYSILKLIRTDRFCV